MKPRAGFLRTLLLTVLSTALLISHPAFAQVGGSSDNDPSDLWLKAYMIMRDGETAGKEGNDQIALSKYREAQRLFDFIARTYPSWKTQMMDFRRRSLLDNIDETRARLRQNNTMDALPQQDRRIAQPGLGPQEAITPRGPSSVEVPRGEGTLVYPPANQAPAPVQLPRYAQPSNPMTNLNQEFADKQRLIDQLIGAKARLEGQLGASNGQLQNLQQKLAEAERVQGQVRGQLTKALADVQAAKAMGGNKLVDLQKQLTRATADFRKANAQSASILNALDEAKKEVEKLRKERDAFSRERNGTMEELARLEKERDDAQAQRDKARTQLAQAEQTMNPKAMEAAEAKLAQALQEKEAVKAAQKKAIAERDDLATKLEEELKKSGELSKANMELLTELKKSKETMGKLQQRVTSLEKDRVKLQTENENLLRERNLLVDERNQLQKSLDEMAILLDASDKISGDMKETIASNLELQKKLQEANRRVTAMQSQGGSTSAEITALKEQVVSIKKERDSLMADNESYQLKVKDLNQKLKSMYGELDQKTAAMKALVEQRDSAVHDRAILEGQLKTANRQVDSLTDDVKKRDTIITTFQKKIGELTGKVEKSEAELVLMRSASEENQLLRGLIRKQLVKQAKLQMYRDLVIQQVGRMDHKSSDLITSLNSMAQESLKLNKEEQALPLFKDPEVSKIVEALQAEASPSAKGDMSKLLSEADSTFGSANAADMIIGSSKKQEIISLSKAANYDFSHGDFTAAETGYLGVLARDPKNVFARCNLGVIYIRQNKLDSAITQFRSALKQNASNPSAHYYLGIVQYKNSNWDEALESFGACVKNDSTNSNAHNYLGLIASDRGWSQRAEREFKKAVAVDPANSDAYFNLSVLYATQSEPSKNLAKEYYHKALHNGAIRDAAMESFINS